MLNPDTGDYTGTRTKGLENAAQMRLKTPLGSWLFNAAIGSRLHQLPRKDTEQTRALAEQYAFQALQPLVTDGRATAVNVTATQTRTGWIDLVVRITEASGQVATFEHPVKVS
ncbi:phage GP46 family protein [Erwinia typographi]|nr:phage GP46 family protein [Erwinia typographi]